MYLSWAVVACHHPNRVMWRVSAAGMVTLMSDRYDVIVVGNGAGGGTLARTLAPSGRKILILERGDYLPREMANCQPQAAPGRERKGEYAW